MRQRKEDTRAEGRVHVFMIGPSLQTQGGISSVLSQYAGISSDLFSYTAVATYSGHGRGLDVLYFSAALAKVFYYAVTVRKAIFHIHTASRGSFLRKSIIALLLYAFNQRVIIHIHGAEFDQFVQRSFFKPLIVRIVNRAHRIIVLSDSWRDIYRHFFSPAKIEVLYNPAKIAQSFSRQRGERPVNVLFMGRIGKRKGCYDIIEAVRRIQGGPFVVNMYGDGETEPMKKQVARYRLTDIVRVGSWVDHTKIRKLYADADILVLPSYAEGLPMSVLEALGSGLPVVSTKIAGIPEAVFDGYNGFLIDPGDVKALAERLSTLIGDASLREVMGQRSLEIARERFSIEAIGEKLKAIYAEVGGFCSGQQAELHARQN